MTREEEIAVAFNDYRDALKLSTFGDFEYIDIQEAFEEGAKWADKHPTNVWHDASEESKEKSRIAIVDKRGEWDVTNYVSDDFDARGLYGWKCCISYYDLKIWAYTDDLFRRYGLYIL